MRSIQLPSPALVLAIIALFAAGTGGAFAAGRITGNQIKDGSITGKDIKNDSLTGTDIKGQVRGPQGPKGEKGDRGPAGASGTGAAGPAITYVYAEQAVGADGSTVRAGCPAGQVVIGGGYQTLDTTDRTPTRNNPAAVPGGTVPTEWEVGIPPAGVGQSDITARSVAICTKPGSVTQIQQAP
jgi:hypothetical protein